MSVNLNDLSPAALKAAMRGGTAAWGAYGSSRDHVLYVEPVGPRSRRRCHCGCGKRATHRGMANGVTPRDPWVMSSEDVRRAAKVFKELEG